MSKRTDAIRSLFSAPQALSADNATVSAGRVSSGAVRSLRGSFSDAEKENEELRRTIASGSLVLELDPSLIDPSPVADRFDAQNDAAYEALKASIAQRGQEVPVLVRRHPRDPNRYQSAYGHRRVRVARELQRSVRAVLRALSDEDLVVAQGVENSAREDLSFIERAVFASRLEDAGYDRSVVQEALAVDRAEASKLVSVARAVPREVVDLIGRAPKVGRGRWQALAEALKAAGAVKRARAATSRQGFSEAGSDDRFLSVLRAATSSKPERAGPSVESQAMMSPDGRRIAVIQKSTRDLKVVIGLLHGEGFADFLVDQLPGLFATYVADQPKDRRGV